MAKKITIDIEVNGKMQKATVSAQKLTDALNKTSKSARTADRNLKGAAQASSNSSKNFSKMAQGMTGGLVPAYAAFAAQVFALTAAFNFLKNAADLENLRKSQVSFAQSSGLAIKSVTNELQEASKGMLGFQEAAQAAAIGAAKGFSTGQLTQLTEGAAKAAGALGRNYQDTFDRLLRGVSKAEPELLDELGITLRLEEATQRYADAIGKSRDSLTSAERSQAVFAETMRQLNDTFGDQEVLVNPFIQLSKTFEKIAQDLTEKLLPAFTGLANIINKNATAAAIAFGALATLVLANIAGLGPALKGAVTGVGKGLASSSKSIVSTFGSLSDKVGTGISDAAKKAVYEIEFAELELQERIKDLGKGNAQAAASKLGGSSKTVQKLALGQEVTPKALGKLKTDLARVKKELKDTGEVAKGVFAGVTLEAVEELEEEIAKIGKTSLTTGEKIQKNLGTKTVKALDKVKKAAKATGNGLRAVGRGAQAAGRGIKFITKVAGKLLFVAGVIGIIIKAFEKLAETPITVIDGFKSFLTGLVSGIETTFNIIIKGINALLDNPVMRKIFGEAPQIAEVKFAENLSKIINDTGKGSLEARLLGALGTTRDDLQATENKTNELKKHENLVENTRQKYVDMKEDVENITKGIAAQNDEFRKTNQIAKGIATLPIAGALTQAMSGKDFEKAFNEVFKGVDFSAFGEKFAQAVADKDIPEIERLTTSAAAYNSSLGAIKNASATLRKDIGTGDPLGARVLLEQLIDTAVAGDTAAKTLERDGGLLDLLSRNAGTDANGLLATLIELETRINNIQQSKSDLAITRVRQSRAPGAVGKQQGLQFAAESAQLDYRAKTAALDQYIAANENLTEKELLAFTQEVTQRKQEIALLNEKAEVAKVNATEIGQLGIAIGDSMASSMASAFDGLIQGTMTAKEAFASMATSMLQSISKVIADLLTAKLLTAALGGGSFGNFLGIPGGKTGGVFSNGGKVSGYATGGVAKGPGSGYPAILHGTEAVVPLPNGKSIPVDMKGAGQNNNVTVNVAIDGQGNARQDKQSDSNEGANLGSAIAAAVQKELHNQKRAGGILNPMGVS